MSLAPIDWAQPWFAPYRAIGQPAAQAALHTSVAAALQQEAAPDSRPAFVPQSALPAGQAYEAHIFQAGTVPTRDNLHDFFNGLVWLRFPRLKRHLNELQAAEIARAGIGPTRGALRDALTLFDENAALWQAPPALAEALRERNWQALFVAQRDAWRHASTVLFGHALLEKLCSPRAAITAHAWWLPAGRGVEDEALSWLDPQTLVSKSHLPLPVLGIPGWCAVNESADFYDDPKVFRHGS